MILQIESDNPVLKAERSLLIAQDRTIKRVKCRSEQAEGDAASHDSFVNPSV